MICNKVLIALAALIAVTAAMPYFLQPNEAEGFEAEYEANPLLWGNAPLKQRPALKWGEWGYRPNEQTASETDVESDVEEVDSSEVEEVESDVEASELETADQTAAGGGNSGNQDPAAGGALGGAGGNSGNAGTNNAAQVMAADDVYAAGGPAPGQLKAMSSRGQGLGIAVGVCLLVVATSTVAVFAIRHYWRHRL